MAQYWQDVQARALVTKEVWVNFFPTLVLGEIIADDFISKYEGLTATAQAAPAN